MSRKSWLEILDRQNYLGIALSQRMRLAVLGVGSEHCGDDAAGLLTARLLKCHVQDNPKVLVLETGPTPENFTSVIRNFNPDLVLILDAAQFGGKPGEIRCIQISDIGGVSASTHTLPLEILAKYLEVEIGCETVLLGIQPRSIEYGARLSSKVAQSVMILAIALTALLKPDYITCFPRKNSARTVARLKQMNSTLLPNYVSR